MRSCSTIDTYGKKMKLTVLVDNNTLIDRYFLAEPGLSFLIEDGDTVVLFDTGYSDIFLKNAWKIGLSLTNIDYLVLSHGHLDHTWGLEPLIKYCFCPDSSIVSCRCPTNRGILKLLLCAL